MSRKNNKNPHPASPKMGEEFVHALGDPSAIAQGAPLRSAQVVRVELTEGEVKLLLQIILATPVQGNVQTLRQMLNRLESLQEKLGKAISG